MRTVFKAALLSLAVAASIGAFFALAILATPAPAAVVGTPNVPSLTVGGRVFTDLRNLKILAVRTSSANNFGTFRAPNGTAGYQVTTGKTLRVTAIKCSTDSASAENYLNVGYGDTDVGFAAASAPTTPVYAYGDSAAAGGLTALTTTGLGSAVEYPLNFTIPASKYPFLIENNAASSIRCVLFGYEE